MLIDQATARYSCDRCEREVDFSEIYVIGELIDYSELCDTCFAERCVEYLMLGRRKEKTDAK